MVKAKKVVPINPDEDIIQMINKKHGEGSIMRLGGAPNQHAEAVPTGLLALDLALGIGGLPKGRIVEMFGIEGCGKTSLAFTMIATMQKAGGRCVYIDVEHAVDTSYAKKLGVDTDNILISQPDYGEKALDILLELVGVGRHSMIVLDSVAGLVTKEELEDGLEDKHMALTARLIGPALRKMAGPAAKAGVIVLLINQIRSTMATNKWAEKFTTPGGRAPKYATSVRLDLRHGAVVKAEDKSRIGHMVNILTVKNKMAAPFRWAKTLMMHGHGFDKTFDILETGIATGIIEQSGASYSFGETKLGYGRDTVLGLLREDAGLAEDLSTAIAHAIQERRGIPISALPAQIDEDTGEVEDAAE